ncbi:MULTISPECIES: hypothetical protein [unclassified Streptomyces]|uniref:hypothetical protein n=1 Tax=unclassified Streptomyces TaxID=2593676 RepID=UPI003826BD19
MLTESYGDAVRVWLQDGAGSGATVQSGQEIREFGARSLWREVETVYREYADLGGPGAEEFGPTVTAGGQSVWLDSPRTGAMTIAPSPGSVTTAR